MSEYKFMKAKLSDGYEIRIMRCSEDPKDSLYEWSSLEGREGFGWKSGLSAPHNVVQDEFNNMIDLDNRKRLPGVNYKNV